MVAGMEPNDSIWALVFDPTDPKVIYAGSFFSGVYQWVDSEGQWVHINLGLRTRCRHRFGNIERWKGVICFHVRRGRLPVR